MSSRIFFKNNYFNILAKATLEPSSCKYNLISYVTMANNQPTNEPNANIEQLSELVKDDPAILQAGISTLPLPEAKPELTIDLQKWFTEIVECSNPKIQETSDQSAKLSPHINSQAITFDIKKWFGDSPKPPKLSRIAISELRTYESSELEVNIKDDGQILNSLAELPFLNDEIISTGSKKQNKSKTLDLKNSIINKKGHKNKNFNEPRKRPNYFIAFPIRSQEIHDNIKKVQNDIIKNNKLLEKTLISLPTLHITLSVMYFDDTDEDTVNKAIELLNKCYEQLLTSKLMNLDLKFEGIGHFSSGVLFAKLSEESPIEKLEKISHIIQETFNDGRITLETKPFKAHLTILKLSKVDFRTKKMCGKITTTLYDEHKDLIVGHDKMNCLQLLSMDKTKDDNGYYFCLKALNFPENV